MFEPAACGWLRLTTVPIVGCDTLLVLKALLRAAQPSGADGVLEARHRSLRATGGVQMPRSVNRARLSPDAFCDNFKVIAPRQIS
jgi:hypothetical protein